MAILMAGIHHFCGISVLCDITVSCSTNVPCGITVLCNITVSCYLCDITVSCSINMPSMCLVVSLFSVTSPCLVICMTSTCPVVSRCLAVSLFCVISPCLVICVMSLFPVDSACPVVSMFPVVSTCLMVSLADSRVDGTDGTPHDKGTEAGTLTILSKGSIIALCDITVSCSTIINIILHFKSCRFTCTLLNSFITGNYIYLLILMILCMFIIAAYNNTFEPESQFFTNVSTVLYISRNCGIPTVLA